MKNILVVGGAGYIGSHTVKTLKTSGFEPVVYDNLSSGHKEAISNVKLVIGELSNKALLSKVIKDENIEAVIHFAGAIDVSESFKDPQKYIKNNCLDGINLILAMLENDVKDIIFSSSAAVYGEPKQTPVVETTTAKPQNPYGLSKLMFEQVLDYYRHNEGLNYVSLRYFNAAGADLNSEIGLDHPKKTDLITSTILTALGQQEKLFLYGTDYDTADGTCVRDYIHVLDLAQAHIMALDFLANNNGSNIFNLGTGHGYSNRQVTDAVRDVSKTDFRVEEAERREGDCVNVVASAAKAKEVLNWQPKHSDLETIISTAYNWHKAHPNGYGS